MTLLVTNDSMQNKFIKGSYILALTLISSVIVTSYLFIHKAIHQKEMDAYIINLAGTQGMLSQNLTQLSLRLNLNQEESSVIKVQLKSQITIWKHSHHVLKYGDLTRGFINPLNTREIDSLYNDLEPSFLILINSCEKLLIPHADIQSLVSIIITQQDIFLPKMKAIVDAYEQESDRKLQHLHLLELTFFIIGIVLLLIISLFIFLPVLKRNDRLFNEIRTKSDLLKMQNSILQKAINNEIETKAAIELNEEKFRFIAENTSDGIMVFENGKVAYTSPSYNRLFGYLDKEKVGMNENSILNNIHPNDSSRVKDLIYGAMANKQTNLVYEYRALHNKGHFIWREDTSTIVYDENDNFLKAIVIARDISSRKEYEKMGREREQLLSSIFDTVKDIIFVLEPNENSYSFSFVNKAFEVTTGMGIDQITGQKLEAILSASSINDAIEKFDEAILENKIVCWQATLHLPKGNLLGEISVTPVFDESDNCIRLIGSIHDLTERIKAEEALKSSHSRLVKLTEKISEAIYELHESADGTVKYQFISQFITQLMPELNIENLQEDASLIYSNIHLEDLNSLILNLESSKINLTQHYVEYRVINADRSIKWIKDAAHPEKRIDGTIVWYGYMEDITQQKEEEKRLQLFESAISNSTESIIISEVDNLAKDKDSILFANDAFFKMTGYSREDITDEFFKKLRGIKTDFNQINRLEEAVLKGEPCEIQIINYKKSGEEFMVNIAIAPVLTGRKDHITHWISIQRDITEEKRNIENIENQNKRFREIAWIQSHLVRAPLAKLLGVVKLLKQNENRTDKDKLIEYIGDSAIELDQVIRDIVNKTDNDLVSI